MVDAVVKAGLMLGGIVAQVDVVVGNEPWWAKASGLLICIMVLLWMHRDLTAKWSKEQQDQRQVFLDVLNRKDADHVAAMERKAKECSEEKTEWGKRFDAVWVEFCRLRGEGE